MKYRFTVFTPTFNRAHTLPRLHESLRRQTFRDFEWLIVDDGSTDRTREIVHSWQCDDSRPFPIRYVFQNNAHKKAAFNRGVSEARGELFLTWDSDDEALPEALELLDRHWRAIPEPARAGFSAVSGLCISTTGEVIGSRFPYDVLDSDSQEIFYRFGVRGDKSGFHRTDVLRKFPFPMNVEGHVPEGIVWSAIASRFRTRFVNAPLLIVHFEEASISRARRSARSNADGLALWQRETLCNELRWFFFKPFWFLKAAANYSRFHFHMQETQPGKRWPISGITPKTLVWVMRPIGALQFWVDKRKSEL